MVTSVVIVGVGGQGVLLASQITASAAINAGYKVKTNEVHGMAQRGGSVIAQIRYGKVVLSPLVPSGGAAVLASLERIEALRYKDLLAPGGRVIVSDQQIVPTTVSTGQAKYPSDAEERLKRVYPNLLYLNAETIAAGLGNPKAANVIVVGAVSMALDLPLEAWHEALASSVKGPRLDLNLKAFDKGRELAQ